jgi:hypothetical protein
VKKQGQRLQSLFIGTLKIAKLACELCKNGLEKYHTTFVEVAEGTTIYNFPIYLLVHLCSKILSLSRAKRAKSTFKLCQPHRARNVAREASCPAASARAIPHRTRTPRQAIDHRSKAHTASTITG